MSGCSAQMRRTPYKQEGDVLMHVLMTFFCVWWKSRMKLALMLLSDKLRK